MPTYEFLCRECGATFEMVSSMAEHDRTKEEKGSVRCTSCGSDEVVPQISQFEVKTTRKSA